MVGDEVDRGANRRVLSVSEAPASGCAPNARPLPGARKATGPAAGEPRLTSADDHGRRIAPGGMTCTL